MAKIDPDLKARILSEISAHVQVYGRREWDRIREKPEYADLIGKASGPNGKRTFFRWVDSVLQPTPPDVTRPHEGREAATASLAAATQQARLAAQKNLPAAPSPAYLMRAGAEGAKNIDFLAAIGVIWEDAVRLRDQALEPDETSPDGTRIADTKGFDASIKRRLEVVDSALSVMQEIWDLQYQKNFYEGITAIIVEELAETPEIQERVIRKLIALNKSRGMTIHAQVA